MLFALALFGCTDDGSACQRIAGPEQTYESRVECLASQGVALESDAAMASDFPSVFAQCMTKAQLAHLGHGTVDIRRAGVTFADASD
jgi:hypothetical protein